MPADASLPSEMEVVGEVDFLTRVKKPEPDGLSSSFFKVMLTSELIDLMRSAWLKEESA